MPFVPSHIRLTNSGKLPEVFLTSKVQSAPDLADRHLGKLYFVLQIDSTWNSVSAIGSSLINMITREYYRQERHTPLESFEYALAKANRLVEQLAREGEDKRDAIHALIALVVGDEIHLAFTGKAEAYYLRDGKLNLVTDDSSTANGQIFGNMITGELSVGDRVFLGSPGTYEAITSDDLLPLLHGSLTESGKSVARRLKQMRIRKANAIILDFETTETVENAALKNNIDTIYLDQKIDSTWHVTSYYLKIIGAPFARLAKLIGKQSSAGLRKLQRTTKKTYREQIQPKAQDLASTATTGSSQLLSQLKEGATPTFSKVGEALNKAKPGKLNLSIPTFSTDKEGGPVVNHYTARRNRSTGLNLLLQTLINLAAATIQQLITTFKRSPRTWYIVTAVVLLIAIGTGIEFRQKDEKINPAVARAIFNEMEDLSEEAKQAKIFGNNNKARAALLDLIAKNNELGKDTEQAKAAQKLVTEAEKELTILAGATHLSGETPLLTLNETAQTGLIHDGNLYYSTDKGEIKQILLTGGEATHLADLPGGKAANLMHLDTAAKTIMVQTFDGQLYQLNGKNLTKLDLADGDVPVGTGLSSFGGIFYLLDPAGSEIWKYTVTGTTVAKEEYTKTSKVSLTDGIGLAIDGNVFALHKTGVVSKYVRGRLNEFSLTNIPTPYDTISNPLNFFAVEDANNYYLADRGNDKIQPRIIEFDKNGQFVHQYLLPQKWQKNIRLVRANPKTHKAWVLVGKELHEFTLVQ